MACSDATATRDGNFAATLRGSEEVPANTSAASGTATVSIVGNTLTYDVNATGFSTPIVVGHIQIGPRNTIGPNIVGFDILAQSGNIAHGTVDLSGPVSFNTLTISGDSLRTLVELGLTYVNLHTAGYPGGEIRGQLVRR
jgi:hypothetical protein